MIFPLLYPLIQLLYIYVLHMKITAEKLYELCREYGARALE